MKQLNRKLEQEMDKDNNNAFDPWDSNLVNVLYHRIYYLWLLKLLDLHFCKVTNRIYNALNSPPNI